MSDAAMAQQACRIAHNVMRERAQHTRRSKRQYPKPLGLLATTTFTSLYDDILASLRRSAPIVAALKEMQVQEFIGPRMQRGYCVIIREEQPHFFAHLEVVAGKYLSDGTVLYPSCFGDYVDRLAAVTLYRAVLEERRIPSEIIILPNPGSEEDMAALFVPHIRA